MEKIEVLGAMTNFNEQSRTITFQLDFFDKDLLSQVESLLQHKKPIKLQFKKVKPFRSKTYQQQKKFWVDFFKILLELRVPKTKENIDQFYYFIRLNIFPARKSFIGYDENDKPKYSPYPPEMKDLTTDEMSKVIEDFHSFYSYLNIDWDAEY